MTANCVLICFTSGVDKNNENSTDFKSRLLEVTVCIYINVHIFSLYKFYKKTIISRAPLSDPHGTPEVEVGIDENNDLLKQKLDV